MQKLIKVQSYLSHTDFLCDKEYFNSFIKDQLLRVVKEYEKISLVEDKMGEQFTIRKSDYLTHTAEEILTIHHSRTSDYLQRILRDFARLVQQMRETQLACSIQLAVARKTKTSTALKEMAKYLSELTELEQKVNKCFCFLAAQYFSESGK